MVGEIGHQGEVGVAGLDADIAAEPVGLNPRDLSRQLMDVTQHGALGPDRNARQHRPLDLDRC